jgi:protein TonB
MERRTTEREEVREEPELKIEAPASELVIETPPAIGPRQAAREAAPEVTESPPAGAPLRRMMAAAPSATGTGVDPLPFQLGAQLGSSGAEDGPRNLPVNLPPAYPREAWLARMEGQVTVRIKISAAGEVTSAKIERSSGWPLLDDAALTAIRRWRFEPARRNGVPVSYELLKPFTFRISS